MPPALSKGRVKENAYRGLLDPVTGIYKKFRWLDRTRTVCADSVLRVAANEKSRSIEKCLPTAALARGRGRRGRSRSLAPRIATSASRRVALCSINISASMRTRIRFGAKLWRRWPRPAFEQHRVHLQGIVLLLVVLKLQLPLHLKSPGWVFRVYDSEFGAWDRT